VVARPDQVPALAKLRQVAGVRLPRAARPQVQAPAGGNEDPRAALRASGLERLHQLGHRGKGTRVAIIDGDFQGYQQMIKRGQLPAGTRCLDLTAERNRDLTPDPFPTTGKEALGHGTRCALALTRAAPEAEIVLVRVDPAAPYLLQEAARYINGEAFRSDNLVQRATELESDSHDIEQRREALVRERRTLLESTAPQDELEKKWEAYRKRQATFDQAEKDHVARINRYLDLTAALRNLKRVRVVASSLVWNDGQPVGGGSALSRYFDDQPFRAALWFQCAGDTRGQAWTGLFRDTDGNGNMEFVPPDTPLPEGRWTPELNFLGWSGGDAEAVDLPAGARIRVTLQWQEAHDPEILRGGEDVYREPLAKLRLLVLRQRDPSGAKLPADDLEVVAQTEKLPQRLQNLPAAATYEHAVEFTVPAAGRYALMIQGQAPKSTRPADRPGLPSKQKSGELRPRVFVSTLDGKGRAVLLDFTTDGPRRSREAGSLGVPGDARAVITVGAADGRGRPEPYSAPGPAADLALLSKPEVLAYDQLGAGVDGEARGTSVAASFAAGLAASALSAGAPRTRFLQAMQAQRGGLLKVPADWPSRGR
jgi:hypothetical protein